MKPSETSVSIISEPDFCLTSISHTSLGHVVSFHELPLGCFV